MKKDTLNNYYELSDRDGIQTLFRKFESATWIFQFDKKGDYIGGVCVSSENMNIIQNAPSIKAGNSTTKQSIKLL